MRTYTFEKTENGTAVITDCSLAEEIIEVPELVLGYPVVGIGDYAFLNNGSISSVRLPEYVASVGDYAFAENGSLESVEIPRRCESISDSAFFNSPNVKVGCYYGSAAFDYARKLQMPYLLLDNALLGDTNGDRSININDVTVMKMHLAELGALSGIRLYAADVTCDGELTIDDATLLQQFLAEFAVDASIGDVMTQ